MSSQWQQQEPGNWVYGESVRGVIRQPLAAVTWRPGQAAFDNWKWLVVLSEGREDSGRAVSLVDGVQSAEARLKEFGMLEDVSHGGAS